MLPDVADEYPSPPPGPTPYFHSIPTCTCDSHLNRAMMVDPTINLLKEYNPPNKTKPTKYINTPPFQIAIPCVYSNSLSIPFLRSLETMKNNIQFVSNLLIHQKLHNISPLIPTQLNNLPTLIIILLHRTIAREILLEGLADSLDIQIIREARDCGDTFTTVTLLDADVDFVGFVSGVVVVSFVESAACF